MSANLSLFLPVPETVHKMMTDLLGKPVQLKRGTPVVVGPKGAGIVAEYIYDHGGIGALAVCDLAFTCHAGAALMLLPPAASVDAVKTGKLTETIIDNIREVLNIAASLFIHEMRPHVRLRSIYPLPGDLPQDVGKIMAKPAARLDLDMTVSGYGVGRISLLTA